MNKHYGPGVEPLDADLESMVLARMNESEIVYMVGGDLATTAVVFCMEKEVYLECREIAELMGGLCCGGGRVFKFVRSEDAWLFSGESGWIC